MFVWTISFSIVWCSTFICFSSVCHFLHMFYRNDFWFAHANEEQPFATVLSKIISQKWREIDWKNEKTKQISNGFQIKSFAKKFQGIVLRLAWSIRFSLLNEYCTRNNKHDFICFVSHEIRWKCIFFLSVLFIRNATTLNVIRMDTIALNALIFHIFLFIILIWQHFSYIP